MVKEEFLKKLEIIHPSLILISDYTVKTNTIIVKDSLNILYKVYPYNLLKGHKPTIKSALDKTKALKNKLNIANPSFKVLGEYKTAKTKILVIDKLGIKYKVTPDKLLQGTNFTSNSAVDKNEYFILKAQKRHNNKYDYSKSNFTNIKNKVIIICKHHGEFEQSADSHLQGSGCVKCGNYFGFTRTQFINLCRNNPNRTPLVYIVKCYNENESFIKIGLTSLSVFDRFNYNIPYEYKILNTLKGTPTYIFNKEKELHKKYKEFKYKPLITFSGSSECFNIKILSDIKNI